MSPQVEKQELPQQPSRMHTDQLSTEPGVFPGATGLKYTQTIMGSRSGGAGMRVSGRRTSTKGSPLVLAPLENNRLNRLRSDSEPTPATPVPPSVRITTGSPDPESLIQHARRRSGGSILSGNGDLDPGADSADTPLAAVFAPQFARGAEMEARRRLRMRARFPSQTSSTDDRPIQPSLSVNGSSANDVFSEDEEDEEDDLEEEDDAEEDDAIDVGGTVDTHDDDDFEGDDFLNP